MVTLRPETAGKTANTSRKDFTWQLKVQSIKLIYYIQIPTFMKGLHRAGCSVLAQSKKICFVFLARNDECLTLNRNGSQNRNGKILVMFKVLAISIHGFCCKNKIIFNIKKASH